MTPRHAAALGAALLLGCGGQGVPEVRVFAASSLTEVMGTLAADFGKETGTKVVLHLASSSTLSRQIADGAPCDLFLSADEEWADWLERSRAPVDAGSRRVLLTNRLVVALAERPSGPLNFGGDLSTRRQDHGEAIRKALLEEGRIRRIAIGDPSHVPAGKLAKRSLERLGIWERCRPRLIPCESVMAARMLVERKEVDAGIVFATDASPGLDISEFGERDPSKEGRLPVVLDRFGQAAYLPGAEARYVGLALTTPAGRGREFLAWLASDRARRIFREAGFGIPGEER